MGEEKPNFKRPGESGSNRFDEMDWIIFVNPPGTSQPDFIIKSPPPDRCPLNICVMSNVIVEGVEGEECNPEFDYEPLFMEVRDRVGRYVDNFGCPEYCPAKSFYISEKVNHYAEWSCHILEDSETNAREPRYNCRFQFYFVCRRVAIKKKQQATTQEKIQHDLG
ncbi:MAG: hypothetical protein ABIH76_05975 [Candidatus Bathyarchaeota archaeon]